MSSLVVPKLGSSEPWGSLGTPSGISGKERGTRLGHSSTSFVCFIHVGSGWELFKNADLILSLPSMAAGWFKDNDQNPCYRLQGWTSPMAAPGAFDPYHRAAVPPSQRPRRSHALSHRTAPSFGPPGQSQLIQGSLPRFPRGALPPAIPSHGTWTFPSGLFPPWSHCSYWNSLMPALPTDP